MSVHFFLDARKSFPNARPVAVRMRLTWSRSHRLSVSTPIRVQPAQWSTHAERLKPSAPGATEINGTLERLRGFATRLMLDALSDEEVRVRLAERLGRGVRRKETPFLELFEAFLEEKKARSKPNTVRSYATLRLHFQTWLRPGFLPSEVGPGFLDDFVSFLLSAGLANRTANKLVGYSKGFLHWLCKREYIEIVPDAAKLPTVRKQVIYLKPDELRRLKEVDLSDLTPGYEKARTIFIFQTMTGQRFSDVAALTWKGLSEDRRWWHLTTQKTGLIARIPLPGPAQEIIARSEGKPRPLPRLSNQKTNQFLKVICRRAGIDEPITTTRQRGGVREQETRPKWELCTSHAARRTFISLFLQGGGPLTDLLGLTHDDLRMVRPYAGVDDEKRRKHVERAVSGM